MSMSIAERIAALNKKAEEGDAPPPPLISKPKANKNALADKIAALSTTGGDNNDDITKSDMSKSKVGKLKPPPAGAIPIMSFGGGPPPSLLKKQKEREERMEKMRQEAALESTAADEDGCEEGASENPKGIGKVKFPEGAVPIMFGAGPPPSLLKKQKEREERMEKMRQEAAAQEHTGISAGVGGADENADDALLSRPTIQGKRRPRTRA